MAEPQKRGNKYYCVNHSFHLQDKDTGNTVVIGPGERIPKMALESDDIFNRLLRDRRICECTKGGAKLERDDEQTLTQPQLKDLVEKPEEMLEVLRRVRFTNNSLLELRSRATLAKLDKSYMAAIDAAIERS